MERVLRHESWRNRGGKRFGQVRTARGLRKLTYFPTSLFGCDLSLLFRHRPHKRQLLPGIHPEPKGHLVRARKGEFTSQGEEARRRASAVPETRGSGVLGAARSAMRRGVTAAWDHSRRTPAPAQPPLQPASRSRDRRGPATTSEIVDSGREDHRAARPHLPLGPDLVPVPRWGRGGTPARGLPDWDGGARSGEAAVHHRPRLPAPHAHHCHGAAQVGGPMRAPPVGRGASAARRKACRPEGRG